MASHADIVARWLDTLEGKRDRRGHPLRNPRSGNVWGEGDTLYSYGRHFPLCEYHRPNRRRRHPLYLLNGDRVSHSTTGHQSTTRAAVLPRAHSQGAQVLILPFSALEAAGILRDSIVPLEVRPDEWITVDDVPCPVDLRDLSTARAILTSESVYGARPDGTFGFSDVPVTVYRWDVDGYRFERRARVPDGPVGDVYVRDHPPGAPSTLSDDWTRLITRRHRLGDSVFLADVPDTRTVSRPVSVRDVVAAAVRSVDLRRRGFAGILDVVDTLDNVDIDSPIVETVPVRRRRRYVSSFDTNEPAPLYFLATLPRTSRARTVADAILDLAPPAVHAAIARGRHVERQGDIFAIETTLTDVDLAGFPRARLTMWTRDARPRKGEVGYIPPLTADERREVTRRARVMWRRARDARPAAGGPASPKGIRRKTRARIAESERSLARARRNARRAVLAYAPPHYASHWGYGADIARARESVAFYVRDLSTARQYRGHARDHYRDSGTIQPGTRALTQWRDCVREATYQLRPLSRPAAVDRRRADIRDVLSIHGTAHSATEVCRAPGGRVYVRGTMRHVPTLEPGRRGGVDHVPRQLREGVWYLAVRNTVPRDTSGGRRR